MSSPEPPDSVAGMDLRSLELIAAVCNAGSLSAAARSLQISQPTLSKSIGRIERELGVRLFDRSGGTARPTALGEFVASRAGPLLQSAAALTRELRNHLQGESGRLTIAAGPATRVRPLPDVIRRAAAAYPGLRIETRQVRGPEAARGVAEGVYDIAITNRETAEPYGDLIRVKLFEDRMAAIVRAGHPLAAAATLDASALLDYPVASFRIGRALSERLGQLDTMQEDRLHAFQTDDSGLLRDYILACDAIAWVPRFILSDELARGEAKELPVSGDAPFECWLLTTPGHWTSPVVQAIASFAREAGAQASI